MGWGDTSNFGGTSSRVTVVQVAPVVMDRDATVEKATRLVEEVVAGGGPCWLVGSSARPL